MEGRHVTFMRNSGNFWIHWMVFIHFMWLTRDDSLMTQNNWQKCICEGISYRNDGKRRNPQKGRDMPCDNICVPDKNGTFFSSIGRISYDLGVFFRHIDSIFSTSYRNNVAFINPLGHAKNPILNTPFLSFFMFVWKLVFILSGSVLCSQYFHKYFGFHWNMER